MKLQWFNHLNAFRCTTLRSSASKPIKLPNIRNPGITLKIILILLGVFSAVSLFEVEQPEKWSGLMLHYVSSSMPVILATLLLMMLTQYFLPRLSTRWVELIVYSGGLMMSNLYYVMILTPEFYFLPQSMQWYLLLKISLITATLISLVMMYLYFIALSLEPANTELRLQSLTYRIRPHFLFNSLNAILALIRRDSRKAEYALEELAELFRWLLKETHQYVSIRKEIDIVQQFIAIEKIRLGDRLNIQWDIDVLAQEAMLPALTLQPLVENAIYHGVESIMEACPISVKISKELGMVILQVSNPFDAGYRRKKSAGIALETIKKRLELCFDIEFKISTDARNGIYTTRLEFPFRDRLWI